ncbi:ATP-dependent DNA helicase sgs1 [Cryptotrichosporon argae]
MDRPRPSLAGSTSSHFSPAAAYNPKLDSLPLEKLQAMIMKNQEERIELLEKKAGLGDGDDEDGFMGEDSDMMDQKIALLSKRVKELKAALAARSQVPRSAPTQLSAPDHDDHDGLHELDIADAEADDDTHELVPPSSPQVKALSTPPRARRAAAISAAIAECADVPADLIFSSPTRPAPSRPLRVEASVPRTLGLGEAGPSTQASRAAPPQVTPVQQRIVKVAPKHPWDKEVEQKLRGVFGISRFREHQKEAIDETMAGKDVFVLMPTGGGKSLTYHLPAVCSSGKTQGVTFVVSPLISLINDQTRHLIKRGVPSIAYTGDLTAADKAEAHEELSRDVPYTKVVYVTPEMLVAGHKIKDILRRLLRRRQLARFVIDEAHCVSQWGHDVSIYLYAATPMVR